MPRTDPSEVDELEELPPLDELDRDESEGPADDDAMPLLDPIEEDVDLDEDETPLDIGLGVEVEEVETDADEPGEVVLDMTELLSEVDEDERPEEADVAGPEELDLSADIDTEGEELLGSNEEGTDEPFEDLVSDELPELDADEPGGFENEAAWLELDSLRDEELPPVGESWSSEQIEIDDPDLAALALTESGIVAGGARVTFLASGQSVQLGRSRVVALAPSREGAVIAETASGELLRVGPDAPPSPVSGACEALAQDRVGLELSGDAPDGELWVHGRGPALARSRDGGVHFVREELPGEILGLGRDAALIRRDGTPMLAERHGEQWTEVPLDDAGNDVALGESVLFVARGQCVALAAAERGLALGAGSGSFVRVSGCLHASALTLGQRDGADKVWVALFLESEERALVVEVDVATRSASVIVELDARGEDDTDRDARIQALLWDPGAGELWAAGAGLLSRSRPPRS